MKHRLTYVFAAGVLATGLAFAQTQTAPSARQGRQAARANWKQNREHRFERIATVLNLTPEQREQAKALMEDARKSSEPLRRQLRANRQQLVEAVKSGNQAEIDRLSAAQGTLMGQLTAIRTKAFQKGYAMLTPEQRQKAEEMRGRWMQQFGGHRGGPRG